MRARGWRRRARRAGALLAAVGFAAVLPTGPASGADPSTPAPESPAAVTVESPAGFDTTPPLQEFVRPSTPRPGRVEFRAERGPVPADNGFTGDGAVQSTVGGEAGSQAIGSSIVNFEGISNRANPFPVAPPDPVGDVGPDHYVEMVNVQFAVYSKTGDLLLGPAEVSTLFEGFEVPDCADFSGDPIVVYDQLADRWLLTQFSTRGPTFYNCIAISQTGDPTGAYYRYAFSTGPNFPDYPKYRVWPNAYFGSSREFAPDGTEGAGVYAFERARMINGSPAARMVRFFVPQGDEPWVVGMGLLPSDLDGSRRPPPGSPNYFVGTMDDGGGLGAPFDGVNVFEFWVSWGPTPVARFLHTASIPVAPFDSIFPCRPRGSRNCIPQPDTDNRIDILSYRQRPIWRLAYRNFGTHEALVTNQSVEARRGIAGVRWYELRRPGDQPIVYQQGTYAPEDGVNRWMGSVAQDRFGNMAAGYSVSSPFVFPGIRYTGRLAGDPAGELPRGEAVLIDGTGSQLGTQRWGDYTSLNVDPTDDCTFWYVNQYYARSTNFGWHTRVGAFRLPGCGGTP